MTQKEIKIQLPGEAVEERIGLLMKVVSHAMRHVAFLLKTDDEIDCKNSMTAETIKTFKRLWVSLAGRGL